LKIVLQIIRQHGQQKFILIDSFSVSPETLQIAHIEATCLPDATSVPSNVLRRRIFLDSSCCRCERNGDSVIGHGINETNIQEGLYDSDAVSDIVHR
jgi:hypothetical protein